MSEYKFYPKLCLVSISELQSQAQVFDEIYSSICGRSASYNAVANTTATNFSELISSDIKAAADENEAAWESALLASTHAVGVIEYYSTAIQAYDNKIEELEEEFASAIASKETKGEKEQVVTEYQELADSAWETLRGKGKEVSGMLGDGPTPEHIRTLTEAGHLGTVPGGLGWIISGEDEYFALPEEMDASEVGEVFQRAAEGDPAALRELDENLALMSAFMAHMARKQESGTELTDKELEFLRHLNTQLDSEVLDRDEQSDDAVGRGEFFASLDNIENSDHLSEEQKEELLAIIGGSVLTSSDETLGGGYDDIPESIRDTLEGPRIYNASTALSNGYSPEWATSFETLTELFERASQASQSENGHPIQGGSELSAITTGTVAGATESLGLGGSDKQTLETMLEISTRNKDANHAILTGEYPNGDEYSHPVEFAHGYGRAGTNREDMLAALFSFDWTDDGSAVSNLTDWISQDGDSGDDAEKERADNAFAGLLELLSDPEVSDTLSGTGVEVEDPNEKGFFWKNAPMGLVNPEISGSFADIFDTYVSDFADPEILNGEGTLKSDFETEYDPESGLAISLEDRISFVSLIAGDPESAGQIFESAERHTHEEIAEYFTDSETASDLESARGTGLLWNSISHGMYDSVSTRIESQNNWIESTNKSIGYGIDLLTTGIPESTVAESVKIMLKELVPEGEWDSQEEAPPNPQSTSDSLSPKLNSMITDATIHTFYNSLDGDTSLIPHEMVDERGKFIKDFNYWDVEDETEARSLRDKTWLEIQGSDLPALPENSDIYKHLSEFQDEMNEQMRNSPQW